jgi:DNA-binding beta-propeller fold protein YncE
MVVLALIAAGDRVGAAKPSPGLTFTKLWTHGHETPGQVSEIPAFDERTNTVWVAGVVGVDVLDATTGALVTHIDVTADGAVNSVAIHNGLAAFAVEAPSQSATCPSCDRRNPGKVLFYDTATRLPSGDVTEVGVGSLPDMLTFTHDGSKLLVANEATPNAAADTTYLAVDPPGSVSIIDVETRTVIATATLNGVTTSGSNVRLPASTGMDFEPEYIAVTQDSTKAFVTLQEGNAIAVLDLVSNEFTEIIGLGAKDFSQAGNEIDPKDNDGVVLFRSVAAKGFYMPDGVATYRWQGGTYLVMANEGDFREDNADAWRRAPSAPSHRWTACACRNPTPLRGTCSPPARVPSPSAARTESWCTTAAASSIAKHGARAVYDDVRSRDKGVEPEGVALLKVGDRTFAFVGLERALKSAVAIFDITDLESVQFVDMIVTDGDLSPEGLAAYKYRGRYYLAIANEVPATAAGATTCHTTLYSLALADRDTEE